MVTSKTTMSGPWLQFLLHWNWRRTVSQSSTTSTSSLPPLHQALVPRMASRHLEEISQSLVTTPTSTHSKHKPSPSYTDHYLLLHKPGEHPQWSFPNWCFAVPVDWYLLTKTFHPQASNQLWRKGFSDLKTHVSAVFTEQVHVGTCASPLCPLLRQIVGISKWTESLIHFPCSPPHFFFLFLLTPTKEENGNFPNYLSA